MKKRLYLHAGLHKTGTSSIQVELTRARHLLKARGYLYPQTGVPSAAPFGQHLLAWSLVKNDALVPTVFGQRATSDDLDRERLWDALYKEIEDAGAANIIISSEEFDILDGEAIRDLGQKLQAYEVVPILFLRSLSDLVESGYRTAVMVSQYPEDISFFLNHHRTRLDYVQLLKDWRSISSTGQLIAASYDDPHLQKDSVLTFLRLMGLGADALQPVRLARQNESLPAFIVEIVRFLRSDGSSEAEIVEWLKTVTRLPFSEDAINRYTLLPEASRETLDEQYRRELVGISSDTDLGSAIYGQLVLPRRHPEPVCIHNIADAIFAFSKEVRPLEPNGVSPNV